ncbi:flagellar hook-basal body complex protein FliE [Clostridium acetireducens DSM 10703]|jgi:flagellar hook-basal body complex protein FliE|uniref:Flagellar hook-basal body complex protein FliE n=1 Tax=Clostridium acetireducens DSM 10703 TaxID=1121290 RepID=A0A1E8F0H4_9CLOT|nr:flagellar hook-basal body complex protein FliE [Clostridium acetireducens]OFI06803.1 flagellar hook-basal body complex protein FliE [Clostridium acetireducens DSM 10703]
MKINPFVPDTKVFENNKLDKSSNINEEKGFSKTLKEKLDKVNDAQVKAENSTESFIKGDDKDIHTLMLDTEEAKMSLELAVQIRNKMVEAYQELNRMQL